MNSLLKKYFPWLWVPSLYFAEGLPYVMVMVVSVVMYKQLGLTNAEITFYTSWLYLPWVIKPLWSPFVDVIKTKRWWIVVMQLLIGAAFAGVAFTIQTKFWLQSTLCFFWLLAFSSATHDIAADGFYMLGLDEHKQAFFVGIRSTFYRFATIFGQGVLVMVAGNLQVIFKGSIKFSWMLIFYGIAALFIGVALYHKFILPKPEQSDITGQQKKLSSKMIWHGLCESVRTFIFCDTPDSKYVLRKEAVTGLLFMLLYRMPEGLIVKISPLFLIDKVEEGGLGLSPQEFGLVQGTVGVIGLTIGGILGGIAAGRDGLKRWLWPMVFAITIPDLVYVYLSYFTDSSLLMINVCIFLEQFGYGFGFTAYMLYLIYYSNGKYKTSHYALCTALMALSMMLPGLVAGALQEALGYQMFFIFVMICCAVTYIVTSRLNIDPHFGKKDVENE